MSGKRIVTFTLLVGMMLSVCMFTSFAQEFYYSENFDEIITNDTFSSGKVVGEQARVVEYKEGQDKGLFFISKDSDASATFTLAGSPEELVVTADVLLSGDRPSGKIVLNDSANKAFNALTIGADGSVFTNDGRKVGSIGMNQWTDITLVFKFNESRYSVFIGGRCVVADWYILSNFPLTAGSIVYSFSAPDGGETQVTIDNVYAYAGDKPISDAELPKKAFNTESKEYVVEVDNEVPGDTVFMNRTFDEEGVDGFSSLAPEAKGNKLTVEMDKKSGNHYVSFVKQSSDDSILDFRFSGTRFVVMEADFSTATTASSGTLFVLKDAANLFNNLMRLNQGGDVVTPDNRFACKLQKNKWTNIAIVCDFKKHVFDLYIDRERLFAKIPMPNADFGFPATWRVTNGGSGTSGDLLVDNMRCYEGNAQRTFDENVKVEISSIMPSDSVAINALGKAVAVSVQGGSIFANGEKTFLDDPPYIKDNRTMLPVRAVADAFGLSVDYDDATEEITLGTKAKMTVGKKEMTVDGKNITLDVAPEVTNDRAFLPLRTLCENVLGKVVSWNDRGFAIISDSEFTTSESNMMEINDYLLYKRPKSTELTGLFETVNQNQHPRVMINQTDLARILDDYENDPLVSKWGAQIIAGADSLIPQAPKPYEIPDGLRLLETSRSILGRIMNLGMAYFLTGGDTKYSDRAWVELQNAANYKDWNAERHFLDPSEMGAAFAIGYDWMYNEWTKDQRKLMEDKMMEYQLNYVKKAYYNSFSASWAKGDNNWNAVCNGGALMAAVALYDKYPDMCSDIVEKALRGVEYMIRYFYPNGAWYEGTGYWGYAMKYYCMMISTTEATFGSNFNLMKAPGLDKTAEFIIALDGPTGNYNFHDAAGSGHSNLAELFWLSNEYNNPGVTSARLYAMDKYNWSAGISNWGENVVNVLFYDTSIKAQEVNLDLDHYFGDTEAVVMRASYTDGQSAYVAYHAGETNCNHSHTDDGTYVIDMMGERWVSNLPGDSYSLPGYFGGGRWDIYRLRAEGHNTLVINPDRTPGQDLSSVTHVEKLESKPRGAISTMDMSTAYPGATNSVRRGFMLSDDRKSVTVRDEIDLKIKSEVYSFIHTMANIEIVDKNTVILEKSGKKVKVQIATNAASAEILNMDPKPLPTSPVVAGQDANNGYRKLAIHFNESGKIYVQMKFTPMADAAADKAMEVLPMDEWTIPDGEVQPVPAVDMIYADGTPISKFDPTAGSYLIKVPYGEDKVPSITADTQEGTSVEIHNATDFKDSSTVKVFWDNNPDNYRMYMVSYMVIPKLDDVNGMTRLQVLNVVASDNPQPENMDVNVIDGDFNTRWSAEGDGQWIMLELEKVQNIDWVAVAVMSGTVRTSSFDIQVSEDGENWTTVKKVTTSGMTDEYEYYETPGAVGKYVRLYGYGNSQNKWNSITEFAALGKK